MWKKTWPILGIASVALNVAFIGISAAQVIRGASGHNESCETSPGHDGVWCPLHRRLGTTPEQWKRIEPRLAEFRTAALSVCQDVGRSRAEMIDLLAAPQPDRQAIAAKQEEILAGQRRMQRLVIEHLLVEKDVLTPEQQKTLFDLMRERARCEGHGPLMGLSETGAMFPPTTSPGGPAR